jgi:hypothetical protein
MRGVLGSIVISLAVWSGWAAAEPRAGATTPVLDSASDLAVTTTTATGCSGCGETGVTSPALDTRSGTENRAPAPVPAAPVATQIIAGPSARYVPPLRGVPSGLVGGGTRGGGRQAYGLRTLTPGHVGQTVEPRPTLYWFNAAPITRYAVELLVTDSRGAGDVDYSRPLVEILLRSPIEPGVHCFRLSAHRLAPGVVYEWSASVVGDGRARSGELDQSLAAIFVTGRPEGLDEALAGATVTERPRLYGERGLWYDLLAALPEAVATPPEDAGLQAAIAALMSEWVGVALQARDFVGLECLEEKLEMNPAVLEVAPAGLDVRP